MWPLSELERRVAQMIRVGVIKSVDASDPTAPTCVVANGALETPSIPWFSARAGNDAEFWCPEVGEQAVVFSPFGDVAQGFALVGLFQDTHPAPSTNPDVHVRKYKDGATIQYDRAAHAYSINIPAGGSFTISIGSTTFVLQEGGAALTGGDITADGIGLKVHHHTDSRSGATSPAEA
jgi:phage baseplate assembly protein V